MFAEAIEEKIRLRMRSDDRVFILRPKEGQSPTKNSGLVDTRLFKGENKLHAVRDKMTSLWSLRYDSGLLPEPLKQRFTSFEALRKFVES